MSIVKNEGNLIFDSVEENGQRVYVAEFKATGPFSLHIERRESGRITVYQKSYENGKYATVKNVDIAPQDTIIDAEVPGGVFPKWIKIKSSSEVEVAEVTFEDEQSGGGAGNSGGGGENTYEYIELTKPEGWVGDDFYGTVVTPLLMLCALLGKVEINGNMVIVAPYMIGIQQLTPIAIAYDPNMLVQADTGPMKVSELLQMFDIPDLPHLTKEQFYNLEA